MSDHSQSPIDGQLKADHDALVKLAQQRRVLLSLMQSDLLKHFANFLEATGGDKTGTMIERYEWFSTRDGGSPDCDYAKAAKGFFMQDEATKVAKEIIWLYNNWAKEFE
jgi:hypothetical protein